MRLSTARSQTLVRLITSYRKTLIVCPPHAFENLNPSPHLPQTEVSLDVSQL